MTTTATKPAPTTGRSALCQTGRHGDCEHEGCGCDCHVAPPDVSLVWEDPPPSGRSSAVVREVEASIAELRKHPMRWARLKVYDKPTSSTAGRKYLEKAYGTDEFEFVSRKFGEDGSAIWGRYVTTAKRR